jgi:hypothetical protein
VDIDALTAEVRRGTHSSNFDLNDDTRVDGEDHRMWVDELRKTYFGDSNLDNEFSSSDFVAVFQAGEYEDMVVGNSTWATGDWNGDRDFDSSDFVTAFQMGGYEKGPRAARTGTTIPGVGTIQSFHPPGLLGFGSTFSAALLNDRGQIVFAVALTAGRRAMLLATPFGKPRMPRCPWETSTAMAVLICPICCQSPLRSYCPGG